MRQRAMTSSSRSLIWMVLAAIIGAVFIYAGAAKISDPGKFGRDILNFRIVPWAVAIRVAFYLPWLEIIAGLALLTGFLRRGALAVLTTLMVFFIVATISAHARGINLDCGCFGGASKGMSFTSHMLIDGALLAGLIALWILPERRVR
jgi:putative oxidoreductase